MVQKDLKEQYKNDDNLKLRRSLHDKYSVNKIGFQKWMFEQYPFYPKMKILELGSGNGENWWGSIYPKFLSISSG